MNAIKRGEPFTVDAKALTMARASRVLAVVPTLIGSLMSLPSALAETELLSASPVAAATTAKASEPEDGSLVAVVAIDGPLSQRGEAWMCGMIDGYDWIAERFTKAIRDPKVGAVVLRINSPGGDVAGLEEVVRRMRDEARSARKRVVAHADELAASAAYWIAAGVADEIWLPPAGQVGSIGCIGAWVDSTAAVEAEGHKVHIFRDPEGKAAAHRFGPVAEVADERMAREVTDVTTRFVAAISKRRGIAESKIRAMNADVYGADEAVARKLADHIGSLEDAINSAASAAREKRMGTKERQALGVADDATDEQITTAGNVRALGAHVLELAGTDDPAAARGKVAAWKEQAAETQQLRTELADVRKAKETGELSAYLLSQVGKRITPAQAWAKDADGMPIGGTPAERWAKMGLAETRAFVEECPPLGLTMAGDGKPEPAVDGLTEAQRRIADEMQMSPEQRAAYARRLAARDAARAARSK